MSKKSKKFGWFLLGGASLAAMVTPAMAQDASSGDVSDEIVVTATGRAAAIQDVPIAVQAISNQTLEEAGVQSLLDLNNLAPTLRIGTGQSTTSSTVASIRGIGTGSDNPGFEGAVGIFIDGVYRSRAGAALGDLPDVERIEILRGPQGTLFGKNTSAGAISVVTAGPDHQLGAWGEIEGSELNGLRSSFGMTGAISDNVALRFDGAIRTQDGYLTDVTSDRDINSTNRWTARFQSLWDINEAASLRLIVDGGSTDENCCGAINIQSGNLIGPLAAIYFPGSLLSDSESQQEQREMTLSPNRSYGEQADDFGISGQLEWDLGGVNLTSITAYRDWSSTRDQDIDFASLDRAYRDGLEIEIENYSQEIRLQGESGRINWLVGAFASRENLDTTDRIRFGDDAQAFTNNATFFLTSLLTPTTARKLYNTPVLIPGTGSTDTFICANQGSFPAMVVAGVCTNAGNTALGSLVGLNNPLDPDYPDNAVDFYAPTLNSGDGQQADTWQQRTSTLSLFTHDEINLSDNLILTLGARYNHETKDLSANLDSINDGCNFLQTTSFNLDPDGPGPAPAGNYNVAALVNHASGGTAAIPFALACNAVTNTLANGTADTDTEENEWSGVASLAYHLSDDLMLYGGYSRGYKAGGFNLDRSGFFGAQNLGAWEGQFGALSNWNIEAIGVASAPLTEDDLHFDPEFTDAYEAGFKSTIFGGTTFFNANVFYEVIHDYQTNNFSGTNFFTINVDELISRGVEVELNSRPMDGLGINFGVLYDDAYYNSDTTWGGSTILAGTPLSQAPKWTVSGSASYHFPIGANYGLTAFADGRWTSGYRTMTLGRNPITDVDSHALFDARLSFGPNDGHWSAEIFGQNLTDEFFYIAGFSAPERASEALGIANSNYYAFVNKPRVVGVTLRARF